MKNTHAQDGQIVHLTRVGFSDLASVMLMIPSIKSLLGSVLNWVILCAVLFNVSVPAGAMLERTTDGKVQIIVCTTQGILNAWLDVETGQLLEYNDEHQEDQDYSNLPTQCLMASPTPMADSDAAGATQIFIRIALPFRAEMTGVKLVIGQSPARLSARGPPISV